MVIVAKYSEISKYIFSQLKTRSQIVSNLARCVSNNKAYAYRDIEEALSLTKINRNNQDVEDLQSQIGCLLINVYIYVSVDSQYIFSMLSLLVFF